MTSQIEKLNTLTTDQEKLDFLKNNSNFVLLLDNDSARIGINEDIPLTENEIANLEELIDYNCSSFLEDFGNRKGIHLLFENLNIKVLEV